MKNIKKIVMSLVVVSVLSTSVVFGVVTAKSPADIVSGLTEKSVEEVTKERADGKTYGTIATEAGKLEEFKIEMLKQKKELLDQRVKEGALTQPQADEIYNSMLINQEACDGTSSAGRGMMNGAGFGQGMGKGLGQGNGSGFGGCRSQETLK